MDIPSAAGRGPEEPNAAGQPSVVSLLPLPSPEAIKEAVRWRQQFDLPTNVQEEVDAAIAYFREVELAVIDAARLGKNISSAIAEVGQRWAGGGRRWPIDVSEMTQWISCEGPTLDYWPPGKVIISDHGHIGGLKPYIDVAEAIGLGVAGNVAYAGLVAFIRDFKRRRKARRERERQQFILDMAEAIELATAAIFIADSEVSTSPVKRTVERVEKDEQEQWDVVLSRPEIPGGEYRVTIPKGDPGTITIKIECETCVREREQAAQHLARLILERARRIRR